MTEPNAIVRIDWDRVAALYSLLEGRSQSLIHKIEVVLGNCPVDEAARRVRATHSLLSNNGLAKADVSFYVNDPSGGPLLTQLVAAVRDLKFNALVAGVAAQSIQERSREVFASLEACRELQAGFKVDITLLDASTVFIDQP